MSIFFKLSKNKKSAIAGYFLLIAVILILVMGIVGTIIMHLFSNRMQLSVAQLNGLRAFYMAESGLEIGARLLTMPSLSGTPARLSCSAIAGTAAVTNASFDSGQLTVTGSGTYGLTLLTGALSSSATTINVSSTSGFASSGRILIDKEAIDYAALSGNSFVGATRGANSTLAASHVSLAPVSQYQCALDVTTGVPTLTSPTAQRELQWNVQLQDGWYVANVSSSNFIMGRWNRPTETVWSTTSLGAGSNAGNLNSVSMLSNADGWAVADKTATSYIFLHWNGLAWALNAIAGTCSQNLLGVSMVSSRNGFAVGVRYRTICGNSGTPFLYTMMQWNGTTWILLTAPTITYDSSTPQDLQSVHVIDTNGDGVGDFGFAVGVGGVILQYNGTTWAPASSPTTKDLNGVFVVSSSEAWAVGNSGVILRWIGGLWNTPASPVTTQLNSIYMLDTDGDGTANVGWAVGNSSKILSYNAGAWSAVDLGGDNLFGVAAYNANDIWVVGAAGVIYHGDGSTWTSVSSSTTRALKAVGLVGQQIKPVSAWRQVFH